MAAREQLGAFSPANFDVAEIGLELLLIDGGSHLHGFVEAVTDLQLLRAVHVAFDELAVDAFLHDDAAGGGAALAGSAEASPESAFDGEVKVGVVEDDHGILPPEFERAMLEALSGDAAHDATNCGRAGQRDGAHVAMLGERRPYLRAEAGHDVDDAFGKSGIDQRANQVEGRQRRVLRGLDDAGVAADDGGQQLPRGDRHGKIPGRDHAADADGLPHRHRELVGHFRGRGGTEHAAPFAGVVVSSVDGFLHVAAGLGEHFTHFAGHVAGMVLLALNQNLGGAEDDLRTARGGDEAPLGECSLGGSDGRVHVSLAGFLEDADYLAGVGGIAIFKRLSARGLDPLAVDEVLENPSLGVAEGGWGGQSLGCHEVS